MRSVVVVALCGDVLRVVVVKGGVSDVIEGIGISRSLEHQDYRDYEGQENGGKKSQNNPFDQIEIVLELLIQNFFTALLIYKVNVLGQHSTASGGVGHHG